MYERSPQKSPQLTDVNPSAETVRSYHTRSHFQFEPFI